MQPFFVFFKPHKGLRLYLFEIDSIEITYSSWTIFNIKDGKSDKLSIYTSGGELLLNQLNVSFLSISAKGKHSMIVLERLRSLKSLQFIGNDDLVEEFHFQDSIFEKEFFARIHRLNTSNLSFNRIINNGILTFEFLKVNIDLSLFFSHMGQVYLFKSPNLPQKWSFESSNIEDIQFYNSTIPKSFNAVLGSNRTIDGELGSIEKVDSQNQLLEEKEAFRQLKFSAIKRGQKENAEIFRKEELIRHRKAITNFNFSEQIALLLSYFTNKHGQSWILPAFIAVFGSLLVFFPLYLWSLDYELSNDHGSLQNFKKFLNSYGLEFLTPSYASPSKGKYDYLAKLAGGKGFQCLSLLSKAILIFHDFIFMPYLIVQTISAFRKHTTK